MESEDNTFISLMTWFKLLEAVAPHSTVSDLSDGVAMSRVLMQIDSEFFSEAWCTKIKSNLGDNWRLKVSNLKKIIERIMDYYADVLNLNISDYTRPDVLKIAERNDAFELGRLLQLILGCAVNCDKKQTYITQLMSLEESCQRNIMRAIQELETLSSVRGKAPRSLLASESDISNSKVSSLLEERDILAQRCHDLDRQVSCLNDEKLSLVNELHKLQAQCKNSGSLSTLDADGQSFGPVVEGSTRYSEMRRQLDTFKEELFKVETAREDLKMKSEQQERELLLCRSRIEELQNASAEASRLKDEVDALRESNDLLKSHEATIASYKKKLEDHGDLKRQIKMLEERNIEYLQQNLELEDVIKKQGVLKTQVEVYKRQLSEAHTKLDLEILKSDKLEFENKELKTENTAIQRERDSLLAERDLLKEACEELQCGNIPKIDVDGNAVSKELLSPALKQRLERLEAENKILREGEGGLAAMQALLDDANSRIEQLRTQLRVANQKSLQIQGLEKENTRSEESEIKLKQTKELNEQRAQQLEEAQTSLATYRQRITVLQDALAQKDAELLGSEEKYRRCIEKAKEIIKGLDPKSTNYSLSSAVNHTKVSSIELESRLAVSAFHRLGLACHRDALDQRLAQISQGQSFLSRQRQATSRKSLGGFKPKNI